MNRLCVVQDVPISLEELTTRVSKQLGEDLGRLATYALPGSCHFILNDTKCGQALQHQLAAYTMKEAIFDMRGPP